MGNTHFKGPILGKDEPEKASGWRSNMPASSDPDYSVYFNDFLVAQDYAAADWVVTEVGVATQVLAADEQGGALLVTNAGSDDDSSSSQSTEEAWSCTAGARMWMSCRIKIGGTDIAQVEFFIGLNITDTTPLVSSDRVGFQISDGNASIEAIAEKDSTETLTDTGQDAVIDTYVKLSMYWDGISRVYYYINDNHVVTHSTNIPDNEQLALTYIVTNGEAVAKTLTIDYLHVIQER